MAVLHRRTLRFQIVTVCPRQVVSNKCAKKVVTFLFIPPEQPLTDSLPRLLHVSHQLPWYSTSANFVVTQEVLDDMVH